MTAFYKPVYSNRDFNSSVVQDCGCVVMVTRTQNAATQAVPIPITFHCSKHLKAPAFGFQKLDSAIQPYDYEKLDECSLCDCAVTAV